MRTNNSTGITKLGLLFTALFFGALAYFGGQVFNFFYAYYELEGLLEQQAMKSQVFSDKEMKETILRRIRELDIPLEAPEELKINRLDGKIVIETEYDEVLVLELGEKVYDLYVFHFNPRVEATL